MIAYQALAATGSAVFVGVITAVFAVAGLIVSIPCGRLIDRYGNVRVGLAGMVICIIGIGVGLLFRSIPGMIAAATLVGGSHICVIIAQQGLVARLAVGAPDAAFGTLTAAVSVGQLVGPPSVTAAAMASATSQTHPNTWMGMLCCGVFFLLTLPTFVALRPVEARLPVLRPPRAAGPISLAGVLRLPGVLRSLLVGAAVIVTVDLLASFIPVWGVSKDISASVIGWLLALRALATITSRFGMASLVGRFGRKTLLIAAMVLMMVALVLLPFADVWWAIPIMVMIGVGLGPPQPLTLAWTSSLSPPHARGTVFGARMTMNRLAQTTLPLVVAAAAAPIGVLAVFWSSAGILAGSTVLVAVTAASTLNRGNPTDDLGGGTPEAG